MQQPVSSTAGQSYTGDEHNLLYWLDYNVDYWLDYNVLYWLDYNLFY